MSGWVGVVERVVVAVAVAIQGLGTCRVRDNCIGLGKSAELRVVVSGAVIEAAIFVLEKERGFLGLR